MVSIIRIVITRPVQPAKPSPLVPGFREKKVIARPSRPFVRPRFPQLPPRLPPPKASSPLELIPGPIDEGWICVGTSDDFAVDEAVKVPFRTVPLVVVRAAKDRQLRVMHDACIHRGAPLHKGRVDGDGCIECPYHGWTYDPNRGNILIPSSPTYAVISMPIKWDVREQNGLVWVTPLAHEDPPVVPMMYDPGTRTVCRSVDLSVPAATLLENGFDITHASWVHARNGAFGSYRQLPHNLVEEEIEGGGIRVSFDYKPSPEGLPARLFGAAIVHNVHQVALPYTTWSEVSFEASGKVQRLVTFVTLTPLEDGKTRMHIRFVRDFALFPLFDLVFWLMGGLIVEQDREVLEEIYPVDKRTREAHGPWDRPTEAYRQRLRRIIFK